jgi:predicted DCC family thiol-disulfide oxidoreductase YuxK
MYDGDCSLCSRVVRLLRRLDVLGRVEFLDVNSQWTTIDSRYPELRQDACLVDIHIADRAGRLRTGFAAYRSLAWVLPITWLAIPALYVPGVPAAGQRVYRFIADHRPRKTCALPPRDTTSRAPHAPPALPPQR